MRSFLRWLVGSINVFDDMASGWPLLARKNDWLRWLWLRIVRADVYGKLMDVGLALVPPWAGGNGPESKIVDNEVGKKTEQHCPRFIWWLCRPDRPKLVMTYAETHWISYVRIYWR
jgi:hypothetical protein